ncbi:MAG TPA: hypothetical protein VFA20_23120 [Myxococcaceae bacterium]|nr:hypothetical protein [Myxococcaceae bacterium]
MLALLIVLATLTDAPPPPDALPGPESSGDRRVGPFSRDTYPSEVSARPLTLPAGMIRASAALDAGWIRLLPAYAWVGGLGVSGSYGLTHQLELTAFAQFDLTPLATNRMGVSGTLLLHDDPAFDLALAAAFDLVPASVSPTPAITLGLPGRLLFADRLFFTFGGHLVSLQLSPPQVRASLELGVGAQVTSSLAVALETDLFKSLSQAYVFHTFVVPLDLSATLAVANGFDLQARVSTFNLFDPGLSGTLTLAGSAYF